MASSPNFGHTPLAAPVVVSTVNASFDGTGTLTTLVTPPSTSSQVPAPIKSGEAYVAANAVSQPSNGARVNRIIATARGTTIAGLLLIWLSDGTTAVVVGRASITAITPSTTVAPWTTTIDLDELPIPVGSTLRASVTTANTIGCLTLGEVL